MHVPTSNWSRPWPPGKSVVPGSSELAVAVARNLAKLMAYKDEYEVARLYSSPEFLASLRAEFAGDVKLRFNLAPPLVAGMTRGQGTC